MKIKYGCIVAWLGIAATSAHAHTPLPGQWQSGGGGGITQNVVAGPIKHRPVNNAPVLWPSQSFSAAELSPNLGGTPFPVVQVSAVFLGTQWLDSNFAADKIQGLDQFFRGYTGSNYSSALNEYFWSNVADTIPDIQYDGHLIEPRVGLGSESPNNVAYFVCQLANEGRLAVAPQRTSYVAVFSSHKRPQGESCGWHGWAISCGESGFLVSYSYNLDQDSECDPGDSLTGHSKGLAALANQSARAISDVRTDSDFTGWTDVLGNEVDDKCAWTFSVPYVTFPDGSKWKLQDLWSNKAYEAGTGAPNIWGQRGCVTGR